MRSLMRKPFLRNFLPALKAKNKLDTFADTIDFVDYFINESKYYLTYNDIALEEEFYRGLGIAIDDNLLYNKLIRVLVFEDTGFISEYFNYHLFRSLPKKIQETLLDIAAIYLSTFLEKNLRYDQNYTNYEYKLISGKATKISLGENEIGFNISKDNQLQAFLEGRDSALIISAPSNADNEVISMDYYPIEQEAYNQLFTAVKNQSLANLSTEVKQKALEYINHNSVIPFTPKELVELNRYYIKKLREVYQEIGTKIINGLETSQDLGSTNSKIYHNLWENLQRSNNTSNDAKELIFNVINNVTNNSTISEKVESELFKLSIVSEGEQYLCVDATTLMGCLALTLED
jgi:hypothetical protein